MAMREFHCEKCGGSRLEQGSDGLYTCRNCGAKYRENTLREQKAALSALLDEQKQESVANCRQNLWKAVHEEYLSNKEIAKWCSELKKLLPADFMANFYEVAIGKNARKFNAFLDSIDAVKFADYIEDVVEFSIKSLESQNVGALKSLITRAYRGETYTQYMTRVEEEAEKLDEGVYNVNVPRDVFVAYSSADMAQVNEFVTYLEDQGITCFVALRNLRHGRGAVENYDSLLKTAMHNCKCVLFLSSERSRRLDCDALKIELPHILNYEPQMGRIEYLLEEYGEETKFVAKTILEEFFKGLEYCRTKEDAVKRITKYVTGFGKPKPEEKKAESKKKLCVACGAENPVGARFCLDCGGSEFVDSIKELLQAREKAAKEKAEREAKEKVEREAKKKAEREARERAEREAKEKAEREAKEKAEREAKEKAEREATKRAMREVEARIEREAREKAAKERAERRAREEAKRRASKKDGEVSAKFRKNLVDTLLIIFSLGVFCLELIGVLSYDTFWLTMEKIMFYVSIIAIICLLVRLPNLSQFCAIACIIVGIGLLVVSIVTLSGGRLSVKSFYVDEEYGIVYAEEKNEYVVWKVLSGTENVVIESEHDGLLVGEIKSSAAKNNSDIRSVSFENGNFTIGKDAFSNCSRLTEVTFGDNSVYTIGKTAFSDCPQLKTVTCGEGSEFTVQKNAFQNCSSLETFSVGSSKIIANTTQDIDCDMQIFGGTTKAVFYLDGGSVSYLADSVGGIVVGNNSRVEISAWYLRSGHSVSLSVGSAVFQDGFDFVGSTVSLALLKDVFIFGTKIMYYPVASVIYLPTSVTYIPDNFFGDDGDGCTVYYAGTEAQWNALSIGSNGNSNYTNGKVAVVYNSAYGD